ncbi:GGDEF domain-containing protein [Telluria beijingensis]|uniref:GGDEF domain-containing protein n=1 Tax=Telluria beijingensis TaxID=3068633 RepID=UPI0027961BF4|nr:GGDEF domain-containing protein [Massilia sp. REN29]
MGAREIGDGDMCVWHETETKAAGGAWTAIRAAMGGAGTVLDPEDEKAFGTAVDRTLSDLLPALGPLFGLAVVVFTVWDFWIAPARAPLTATLRLLLVLAGAMGYGHWGGRLSAPVRCALVYISHTSAMILSAALLPNGLVLALPAISGAMFLLALVEPRLGRFFCITLPPMLLFMLLGALELSQPAFASSMLVHAAMLPLAAAVCMTQGRWRRAAFLGERALAHAAHHDSLSGVFARGYLVELGNHDVALAKRHGRPLAIGMVDIDYFKRVNDSFGHAAGDLLLCAVSKACCAQLRASDYFGRIGGEEFVCVMPETTEDDALACAERMRAAVAAIRIETASGILGCTISVGIAALQREHADFDGLLAAADSAMYRAKTSGRNRVVLAAPRLCY